MKAEIITIGDEILIGQIVDSNSAWLATELNKIGVEVFQITSISDNKNHIINTLNDAVARTDLIILTGGIGPTKDDVTKSTLAEYFNDKLVLNKDALENIKTFLKERHVPMNELNKKQAEVPSKCRIFRNKTGTAPGMWFEKNGKIIISIPGVPYEMKYLMKNGMLEEISKKAGKGILSHQTIVVQGYAEAVLAEKLESWQNEMPENIKVAFLPSPGIVRIRLSARSDEQTESDDLFTPQINKLRKYLGNNIVSYDDSPIQEVIGKILRNNNKSLATAESCTGGNIAKLITAVPGSSDYYKGSVVAYSNETKQKLLNVRTSSLEHYGAVSKRVVEEMAYGARKLLNSDYAIATSGVAGPTGGTKDKPVGLVWIAVSTENSIISEKFNFGGNRQRNIDKSSVAGLNLLLKTIK